MPIAASGPRSGWRRRMAASSLRTPSAAASAACRRAITSLVCQRRLDLGEAGSDQPGLAGHGQRIEDGTFEQPFGPGDQIRGQANLPLETAGERLALDRSASASRVAVTQTPRPGQLALEIRDRLAVRPDDEADQVGDRPHRARCHAQPLELARCAVRHRARYRRDRCDHALRRLLRPAPRRRALLVGGRRRQIGLGDPAGLQPRLHDDALRPPRATSRSRRECRLRARSRRPCARSSRQDRRWRSRRDPRPS